MSRRITLTLASLALILILVFTSTACFNSEKPTEPVTLQLNWFHAAEFIGYYMADSLGYYRDAGLKVTIAQGGPGIPARDYILDGKAEFAVASFGEQKDLLAARKPSTAVMSVFQIPPLVMFSLADSGIKEPRDMVGKNIGIKNDYWKEISRQTLQNAGIDPSQVNEVPVPSDGQHLLYEHQVDVWMGYAHDEPISAEMAGYKVNLIYPADYGVGGYEGLLLANDSLVTQKPDLVRRFVQASCQGLQYALEHPDEAAEVLAKWQPNDTVDYGKLAVRALIPLVDTPQSQIGQIDSQRWEQLLGDNYNPQHPGFTAEFINEK